MVCNGNKTIYIHLWIRSLFFFLNENCEITTIHWWMAGTVNWAVGFIHLPLRNGEPCEANWGITIFHGNYWIFLGLYVISTFNGLFFLGNIYWKPWFLPWKRELCCKTSWSRIIYVSLSDFMKGHLNDATWDTITCVFSVRNGEQHTRNTIPKYHHLWSLLGKGHLPVVWVKPRCCYQSLVMKVGISRINNTTLKPDAVYI